MAPPKKHSGNGPAGAVNGGTTVARKVRVTDTASYNYKYCDACTENRKQPAKAAGRCKNKKKGCKDCEALNIGWSVSRRRTARAQNGTRNVVNTGITVANTDINVANTVVNVANTVVNVANTDINVVNIDINVANTDINVVNIDVNGTDSEAVTEEDDCTLVESHPRIPSEEEMHASFAMRVASARSCEGSFFQSSLDAACIAIQEAEDRVQAYRGRDMPMESQAAELLDLYDASREYDLEYSKRGDPMLLGINW